MRANDIVQAAPP